MENKLPFRHLVILVFLTVFSGCMLTTPPGMPGHPLNRDTGIYKPVDMTVGNYMKSSIGLFNFLKFPFIYGNYVIPVLATGARIGKTVIQKGAIKCYFGLICKNQMRFNELQDIKDYRIATVDLNVRSGIYLMFVEVDVLISYDDKKVYKSVLDSL